ncbi:hypothetical protein LTR47_007993 [Exophiala xenobiotica]|nr:hypothetical protein LTR41_002744 [Exophiala xenobiotica]KAK5218712.1 hypothetical protein LTR72_008651 [Exophiala xenobiotica]KAK5229102.1 hypothetical protein LTR47_007993 [Exophiala xenobiotica]KAK5253022.1 hypothetical protein LTS06_002480 [Exophiala xenobiotica]KAK5290311.1 hypothetical protein LTR14_006614 [Exophiala xenobiotica]
MRLDTFQSLYILALLDAFYVPSQTYHPTFEYGKLVQRARSSGYFGEAGLVFEGSQPSWNSWINRESRRRTVFFLYTLDTIKSVFFKEPPQILPYEIGLQLPCHENIFVCKTQHEWETLYLKSDLSNLEYRVILLYFLSEGPTPKRIKISLSVMGSLVVLHGILACIWATGQHGRWKNSPNLSSDEKQVFSVLSDHRTKVTTSALQFWLDCWRTTVSDPHLGYASSFHLDRVMSYWALGCLISLPDNPFLQFIPDDKNAEWSLVVPKLIKRLIILSRGGHFNLIATVAQARALLLNQVLHNAKDVEIPEDDGQLSDAVADQTKDPERHSLARSPRPCEKDTMESITVTFMLSKDEA